MKKIILTLVAVFAAISLLAQNDKADNILGIYKAGYDQEAYKVQIVKSPDGSYKASICWVSETHDANGKLMTDIKNPDKSLRNVPLDKVVLISGLKYNNAKKRWDGAKIYDPVRGIKVSATLSFDSPKILKVRGSVLGIGETVVWTKE